MDDIDGESIYLNLLHEEQIHHLRQPTLDRLLTRGIADWEGRMAEYKCKNLYGKWEEWEMDRVTHSIKE